MLILQGGCIIREGEMGKEKREPTGSRGYVGYDTWLLKPILKNTDD